MHVFEPCFQIGFWNKTEQLRSIVFLKAVCYLPGSLSSPRQTSASNFSLVSHHIVLYLPSDPRCSPLVIFSLCQLLLSLSSLV